MTEKVSRYTHPITTGLILIITSLGGSSVSASYLDELEREAARSFEVPAATTQPGQAEARHNILTSGHENQIQPELDKEGFEQALQNNFYGSYLFYSRLSAQDQQAVYQEYTQNNDIEHLRGVINAKLR